MPIAEFGKAMLRGMGWKDGTAIGKSNKGLVTYVCVCIGTVSLSEVMLLPL